MMYHIQVKYQNLNNEETLEDLYFHISSSDWVKADAEKKDVGGYAEYLQNAIKDEDPAKVLSVLEDLIKLSYGRKSADGRKFIKDRDYTEEFLDSIAYDAFLDELLYTDGVSQAFVTALSPKGGPKPPAV